MSNDLMLMTCRSTNGCSVSPRPPSISDRVIKTDPDSQIKSIAVSPDPPVPGKNLTVTVEADVSETITVGHFTLPSMLYQDYQIRQIILEVAAMLIDVGRGLRRRDCQTRSYQAPPEAI